MNLIDRTRFLNTFKFGLNLAAHEQELRAALQGTAVTYEELQGIAGENSVIDPSEVGRLFDLLDKKIPDNFDGALLADPGTDGNKVWSAFVELRNDVPSSYGAAIAATANNFVTDPTTAQGYAFDSSPATGPGRGLSGFNKCNVFVGDVLTATGFTAPTQFDERNRLHYVEAEKWPSFGNLFDRVTDMNDVRPGDVIVWDYPGATGGDGGHVEVVVSVTPGDPPKVVTAGAHAAGASTRDANQTYPVLYNGYVNYDSEHQCFYWRRDIDPTVYILRPTAATVELADPEEPVATSTGAEQTPSIRRHDPRLPQPR